MARECMKEVRMLKDKSEKIMFKNARQNDCI
jgi:hypothetical protein